MVAQPETFEAVLVEARPLSSRVRHLVFERADGRPFTFESGQWVSLVLPELDEKGRPLRRSYSIASAPTGGPRFECAVTLVDGGKGSPWLHRLQVGQRLEAKGPQGFFVRRVRDAQPSLYVATGTGIAPFRGMLRDAVLEGSTVPFWLLFGIRTPADALFLDELRGLQAAHPWLRVELSLSRPPLGWAGRTGYVQEHVALLWNELTALGHQPHAYVCGVGKMCFAVRDVLKGALQVERQRIHLETYD